MRYSKQRELVLQKVEQLCDHPTAEEIFGLAVRGMSRPEPWYRLPQPQQPRRCGPRPPRLHPGQG